MENVMKIVTTDSREISDILINHYTRKCKVPSTEEMWSSRKLHLLKLDVIRKLLV